MMYSFDKNVTHIDLSGNGICDDLWHLCKFILKENISCLDLSNNFIGEDGIKNLSKVLEANKSLKELTLDHNSLNGDCLFILAESLILNDTLEILNFRRNNIFNKDIERFINKIDKNTTLKEINFERIDIILDVSYLSIFIERNKKIQKDVKSISDMILTSTSMEFGGRFVPKDIRRLLAKYVYKLKGKWLHK